MKIGIAATIYWLGHIGVYKFGLLAERKKIRDYQEVRKSYNTFNGTSTNSHIKKLEKILLTDKLFLNHSISLDVLADKLKLSPSYLSKVIKKELNISFTDYLNNLRIKEAVSYLNNPEFENYTITAIGLEAGFNSKSAFYDVFKKVTGKTPLAYKKEM